MRCETARRALSDRVDGGSVGFAPEDLDAHVRACPDCATFEARLGQVRRRLRVSLLEPPPDITGPVRARLEARSRLATPRPALQEAQAPREQEEPERARSAAARPAPLITRAAAVFVVAFALGAAAVGLTGPPRAQAVDLGELVRTGQHAVESLAADVTVVESGWHPQVPERRYAGTLRYGAPETFELVLEDRTDYPAGPWRPNDVTVAVDDARAWSRGLVGCPVSALPECTPATPRVEVVTGREPFDATEPVPLELVVPVNSFALSSASDRASVEERGGREVVVAEVPAAQIQPLLDGVLGVGNWRRVHPTDRAEVTLDVELGIPLAVRVTVGAAAERQRWASALGYQEAAGDPVLSWRLDDVAVNRAAAPIDLPDAPEAAAPDDRGFVDAEAVDAPASSWLPEGMAPHRSGRVGALAVTSWSDGRAWLRVRAHPDWDRARLFGRSGSQLVRRTALPSGPVVYVAEGGDQVFVHTATVDVEVAGSLSTAQLLRVAEGLGLDGVAVPAGWAEASAATLAEAQAALPGLLVAGELPGFRGPSVRVEGGVVSLGYAGNGDRGFVLTQAAGTTLSPPLDDVVIGVAVRGAAGRYTPSTGALEWTEHGMVVSLRSRSLSLGELLAVAERLASRAGPDDGGALESAP